jgi:hypothetical protein
MENQHSTWLSQGSNNPGSSALEAFTAKGSLQHLPGSDIRRVPAWSKSGYAHSTCPTAGLSSEMS